MCYFSYIFFHCFAINFQCAIREWELHVIILFIHKLWSFECAVFGVNLVTIMAFNFNVWSIDKLNMEIISYLESEYDFFCAWERFVGDHFKKAIGAINWIWKIYSWKRHSWTSFAHEEEQVGLRCNIY